MEFSTDLPDDDVAWLDALREELGMDSRSKMLHEAVRALRGCVDGDGLVFLPGGEDKPSGPWWPGAVSYRRSDSIMAWR
jgi:hypothetical protein